MKFEFEKYPDYVNRIPKSGKHILAYGNEEAIMVYQAYRKEIADYALTNQHFGGPDFSYNRMSWIKPNFLWMMYRSGWGTKIGQERILAIWIRKDFFEQVLGQAVYSSFQSDIYKSNDDWKADLDSKKVRLQWDPDHDPNGVQQERKAIQLGLKLDVLKEFGQSQILKIEDMSEFIGTQRLVLERNELSELLVPKETIFVPTNESIRTYIGLNNFLQL